MNKPRFNAFGWATVTYEDGDYFLSAKFDTLAAARAFYKAKKAAGVYVKYA